MEKRISIISRIRRYFCGLIDQTGRNKGGYIDVENNYSVFGDLNNDYYYLDEKHDNIDEVQNNLNNLLSYSEYVKQLSIANIS